MGRMRSCFLPAAVLTLVATLAFAVQQAVAQELPSNFVAASDPATSGDQRLVYKVIHQYEQLLNAANAEAIVDLFAMDSVVEWNDTPTFTTRQQKVGCLWEHRHRTDASPGRSHRDSERQKCSRPQSRSLCAEKARRWLEDPGLYVQY